MAKIIKKGADLEGQLKSCIRKKKRCLWAALALFIIGAAGLIATPLLIGSEGVAGIATVAFVSCLFAALLSLLFGIFIYNNAMDILAAGIKGERNAVKYVRLLPDSYTVFSNLSLAYRDKKSEMDLVIVGPTGVFIVEIKNQNGTIVGDVGGQSWTQHKVGRGGTPYAKRLYSPIKQVGTHVFVLANYLKSKGIRAYVSPVVYFANEETVVRVSGTDGKTSLFAASENGAGELIRYITSSRAAPSQEELSKIITVLKKA